MIRSSLICLMIAALICCSCSNGGSSGNQATKGPALSVDLAAAEGVLDGVHLLRSSVFFNPRSDEGWRIYFDEFAGGHYTARLWGLFEWNIAHSTDVTSFLAGLEAERPRLELLAQTHDKWIVTIAYMPTWLSRSDDHTPVDAFWNVSSAYGPKDDAVWKQVVQETVLFLQQFPGVEIYYEFWNEPDGIEFWRGDIDEFLGLYEKTVLAIREINPTAKVGGPGVNQWDGKATASPGRGPISDELIVFTKAQGLPLDFISWHEYNGDPSTPLRTKTAYETLMQNNGYLIMPEFVVSEWSFHMDYTGTPYAAVSTAEHMLWFAIAGIDIHTSTWQEFGAGPPSWGMLTSAGVKKPEYYTHLFFDLLAQDTLGVTAFFSADQLIKGVVSKKSNDIYDILLWEVVAAEDMADYLSNPGKISHILLEFPGFVNIQIEEAETVFYGPNPQPVIIKGNRLACYLPKLVLLRLRIRAEPTV